MWQMNGKPTVDVAIAAGEVTTEMVSGRSVAVIDVFRATSVIVEAIHNGAARVIPVVTIEEALAMREKFAGKHVLLGGERNTVKIEGFDKDNSPLAYTRADVEGATIVFTTTNGTRAIYNSRDAHVIYVAAFINMSAVCEALAAIGRDVVLVCSGRQDHFTAEDGLCAGAMADVLVKRYGYGTTDIAEVMQRMWLDARDDVKGRLSTTYHYNDIVRRGYFADIDFCLQRDIYDTVPCYDQKGEIKKLDPDETRK